VGEYPCMMSPHCMKVSGIPLGNNVTAKRLLCYRFQNCLGTSLPMYLYESRTPIDKSTRPLLRWLHRLRLACPGKQLNWQSRPILWLIVGSFDRVRRPEVCIDHCPVRPRCDKAWPGYPDRRVSRPPCSALERKGCHNKVMRGAGSGGWSASHTCPLIGNAALAPTHLAKLSGLHSMFC